MCIFKLQGCNDWQHCRLTTPTYARQVSIGLHSGPGGEFRTALRCQQVEASVLKPGASAWQPRCQRHATW